MSFEGEIGEIDLIDKLVELGRESFTGAIRFENDGIIKIIYFKSGDILSASTNDRSDSIDEILLRAGKVTREHVKQALSKRKETETLGDAMLGLGFITRKELTWARRAQAIGILRSLRGWTAGQYTIVADYLPKREEGTLFPLQQMLVELVVTETDRSRFDKATDGGSAVFHKSDTFDDAFRKLGLNQDAEDIAKYIDGRNSAADVAAASGKDAFNVYKLLEALRALGLLTKAQAFSHLSSFDDFEQAGVADAADAWQGEEAPVPEPEPQPSFDLDDEPALTYTPAPPSSAWDDTPDEPEPVAPAGSSSPAMPAWDSTPKTREIPTTPAPAVPELHVDPEPQWGFDEAQLETARRAVDAGEAEPAKSSKKGAKAAVAKAAKPNRVVGVLIGGVVLLILFAAGWLGYGWYLEHNAAPAPVAVKRPARKRPPVTPPTATTPVTETTTTAPPSNALVVTSTLPPNTTTTATTPAPAPVPVPVPAPVTPIVATNTAPPPSTDATRAKYDAMARESAASATGAYTLQFELVCETSSLTKAIQQAGDKVWFTPLSYRGRSCYRVYWGRYATAAEAAAATGEIPASLRENNKPVVVRVTKQP